MIFSFRLSILHSLRANRMLFKSNYLGVLMSYKDPHQNLIQLATKTTKDDDMLNMPANAKFNLSNLPVLVKPSFLDSLKEKLGMQGTYR